MKKLLFILLTILSIPSKGQNIDSLVSLGLIQIDSSFIMFYDTIQFPVNYISCVIDNNNKIENVIIHGDTLKAITKYVQQSTDDYYRLFEDYHQLQKNYYKLTDIFQQYIERAIEIFE